MENKTWLYINLILASLMLIMGGILLVWVGQQTSDSPAKPDEYAEQRGKVMENFTLTTLNGDEARLSDYDGQVVLINFWATWCPPCTAELPDINTFYEAHQDEGFVVLAINAKEDVNTVDDFIKIKEFDFPVLLDSDGSLMRRYIVLGLPTTFILDRDGIIRHTQSGIITPQQLKEIIMPLL
ncbi:redoxin domain-containing protein [Anaerolineales bacterium HSG6]|nr:redoxin domain-containing protein [Anaerolineales bacterium HSG6]